MSGELFFRNAVILAKLETTEGTDAVPTASANAILGYDVTINPLQGKSVQRPIQRPYMGAYPEVLVGKYVSLNFKVEMAGSGAAATAAAWAPLVRACGCAQTAFANTAAGTIHTGYTASVGALGAFTFAKTAAYTGNRGRDVTLTCTLDGGTGTATFDVDAPAAGNLAVYHADDVLMTNSSAFAIGGGATITPTITHSFTAGEIFTLRVDPPRYEYTPISQSFESISLYFYMDSVLHKAPGARGEMGWSVENGIPYLTFAFNGLYAAPTDASPSGTDFTAFKDPLVAELANTPVFSLHGVSPKLTSFSGSFGNKVEPRILVNSENVPLTDRGVTGKVKIDMKSLATKDWFALAVAATQDVLAFQHGDAAGKIIRIDANQVQLKSPQYGNDRGVVTTDMDLIFVPSSAGNDEIKLTTC